ncbi:enoyl-CoA hydratase/isomerase family protein [Nocardioides campestrisoli]|uniref:enoyl-CoA hydratase/isomerase family protein n=1 Tax=Nocardioides campestrisoli TaxID=2736757 RepID=UPI0015E7C2EC|nr:enoyl-CoA hydratase-related protein [Nocardioides campestrisoli]
MADSVLLDTRDGVATLTLNRPEAMNSLDVETKERLRDLVVQVARAPEVRAVLLTGAGPAFSVGQDLDEHVTLLRQHEAEQVFETVERHYNPIIETLATMDKPVVCAVNGMAAGAGASLALACDLRIMAQGAAFNFAFTRVGLSCDSGVSWTLPRLVGPERALELLYLHETVRADDAVRLGLASRVVADDELGSVASELAARLAQGPTVALGAIRRSLAYAAEHTLPDTLAFEGQMMRLSGGTADHLAAVESFLAKQRPVFRGR